MHHSHEGDKKGETSALLKVQPGDGYLHGWISSKNPVQGGLLMGMDRHRGSPKLGTGVHEPHVPLMGRGGSGHNYDRGAASPLRGYGYGETSPPEWESDGESGLPIR